MLPNTISLGNNFTLDFYTNSKTDIIKISCIHVAIEKFIFLAEASQDWWLEPTTNLLEPAGYGWSWLEPAGASWSQLEPAGASWSQLELEPELEPNLCRLTQALPNI